MVLTLLVNVLGEFGGPPPFPRVCPPWFPSEVRWEGGSKPLIVSAIVALAAAIVTIANVVPGVVVEPQQWRS